MTPSAPCSGFVWFRWLRPSTWHRWEPCWVVFYGLTAVIVPSRLMPAYLKAAPAGTWNKARRTLDYCAVCGKAKVIPT